MRETMRKQRPAALRTVTAPPATTSSSPPSSLINSTITDPQQQQVTLTAKPKSQRQHLSPTPAARAAYNTSGAFELRSQQRRDQNLDLDLKPRPGLTHRTNTSASGKRSFSVRDTSRELRDIYRAGPPSEGEVLKDLVVAGYVTLREKQKKSAVKRKERKEAERLAAQEDQKRAEEEVRARIWEDEARAEEYKKMLATEMERDLKEVKILEGRESWEQEAINTRSTVNWQQY